MEPEFIDEEERIPLLDRRRTSETTACTRIRKQKRPSLTCNKKPRKQSSAHVNATWRGKTGKSTPWRADSTSKYHPEERIRFRLSAVTSRLKNPQGEFVNITKSNGEFLGRKYHAQPSRNVSCSRATRYRDTLVG